MLNNHQTAPAPPGLSAIEQIIADLKYKYQKEEQRTSELEKLLAESHSRRDSLYVTIASLETEYGLTNKVDPESEVQETLTQQVERKPIQLPIETLMPNVSSWVKPTDVSWVDLVRGAIKALNEPLSINEIADYLGMDEKAKDKHFQTLSGVLASYRNSQHLIGIRTYMKTQKGATFSQFFTGLPSFFENELPEQLKPYYDARLKEKLRKRQLFLSEKEAANS